ncbi:penicillin-binding transpeptidase domain-containing protein [Neobacillus sp. OS1-33]|jgi:penicillin-binding protein 2B|uniref:penicillin-binding transpeptidase domain-containing protein n=1 Tax=Neobacillus sp. OS1-33 TaxID=3070683 RepID=UPI0027DECCD0|nr:penicillin-binding transpeptidase domain-containing protein [Neobacillus sp. OS1-33]WML27569.1 penicillin-binding transpeptidase domain-containing protein [Neobacillus sp. OS1-33]
MNKKQPYMNVGAAILFGFFGLLFFVLIFRYFSIQISGEVDGQPLAAKAQEKYSREGNLTALRGDIFDRNGGVIAEDTNAYTIIAILDKKMTTNPKKPQHVKNLDKTARELSKYLEMDESEIYSILSKGKKSKKFQVEFGKSGRDITNQTKKKIEDLKLPGITFIRDSKRFYPNGVFASHLVGYADRIEQKDKTIKSIGKMGIEKILNDELTGKNGKVNFESDLWGYILPDGKEKISPAQNGNDVYLTIDQKIQTFLEDAMNKVDKEYKPEKIIAIVADPKTGEILAMGQRPTFHPKTKEGIDKGWHNEAIETSFEPGSTMKIFTLAAAVQEKVFNPNETYQSGSYQVTNKDKAIHDHNYSGWGTISYLEGVQRSSNVAFAKIAKEKLGFEKFREYLTKFGFDKPTGIDLPDETSGKIQFTYPIEKITTAYGQGTAITPIQQIQAATAIANDGKMIKPHVVKKIVNHDTGETIKSNSPEVVSTPISKETAKQVRDILETVVTSPNGTGGRYKIDGYSVAGKTGTANIPGPNGRYLQGADNYMFSFLGMAPKDDPKLIVYVAVQQPDLDGTGMGALPVSGIFNPVMKNSLQYLNIKPSKSQKAQLNKLSDFIGKSADETEKELKAKGIESVVIGKGVKVVRQLPASGTTVLEGEKVIIQTDGEKLAPNMTGWSLRDVMKVANIAGLKLNSKGQGYVAQQNIKPKTIMRNGDFLIVDLKTPEEQWNLDNKAGSDVQEKTEVKVQD